jgi:hypothetical protein
MEYLLDPTVRRKRKPEQMLGLMFNKHTITEDLLHSAVIPGYEYFLKVFKDRKIKYELEVTAPFPMIDGAFGTTDITGFPNDDTLIIFDWKFGKGVKVFADHNTQLMFYAACAVERYGLWRKIKLIDMHICQPRIDHYDRCVIDMSQLRAFRHALIRAVNGNRKLETGSHCRWCAGFCQW